MLASELIERLKREIVAAMNYKSGPDSCNSVYAGSLLRHQVFTALGSASDRDIERAVSFASEAQLRKALYLLSGVLKYMQQHPLKECEKTA